MAEQLGHIEDRLGAGTGPMVDSPETALLTPTKILRSAIDHVDGVAPRTHENYHAIHTIEEGWNPPSGD